MSDNMQNITQDEQFMLLALTEARMCLEHDDVPIGALIVHDGEIIGRGRNMVEETGNPLAHAEIMAINEAISNYGYKHLLGCAIYVTLEPCSMCSGAIVLARIARLVYGAKDPKTGASGSLYNIPMDARLNHRPEVVPGILGSECSERLKEFFRELRLKKGKSK